MRKLVLFLTALGLGAVAYALVRADREGAMIAPADSPKAKEGEPTRCAATVASGARCSRDAEPGSEFCWQHG